jgi:hypothetical protein
MTEQQLMHYGLAALTVIAIWIGWKVTMKFLKYIFFFIAIAAVAVLLFSIL